MTLPDYKGAAHPTYAAAPGTYIVELGESGAILKTPVIGWAPEGENPYRAPYPITVDGLARMIDGRAILHPCGMVHSRDHALCFESVDEWKVIALKGPRAAEPKETPRAPAAKTTKPADPDDAPALKIEWTTKPFKTNSFYRYEDGDLDFIFQVDGGLNPPKQKEPVTKIKRDEFMALKKTVDVAEYDDLLEGRAPGLDDIGSFEDEDDDLVGGGSEEADDDDLI